jgi:hypothetical protein
VEEKISIKKIKPDVLLLLGMNVFMNPNNPKKVKINTQIRLTPKGVGTYCIVPKTSADIIPDLKPSRFEYGFW